ncbi:hypothetical protein QTP70_031658 [Hemibagrus guttatus]|uniref:Uncharacterized protein n=1 Tax=Hemibagrus guttatus TaxID=175788 RepID=A0AAE0REN7_9TELE|nr:hypothetical protein QTP70_031658 [Hemibagrus guttatus]
MFFLSSSLSLSLSFFLQPPQSHCCVSLQMGVRRSDRARASIPRMADRGLGKESSFLNCKERRHGSRAEMRWHFLGSPATGMMAQGNLPDAGLAHSRCELHYPNLASSRSLPRRTQTQSGMALSYDPAAMQNGFYSSPYSISTNRMIAQTSITPFIAASPVSTYQVQSTSWMPHQQYVMQPTGAVITPAMDHTISMQPANMMGPLAQQMNHLSLGTTGTYMTAAAAAAPMQGTYIPQYTAVPASAISVEGVVTEASPQSVPPSSQDASGQQQPLCVDGTADHTPTYSYQPAKASLGANQFLPQHVLANILYESATTGQGISKAGDL